MVWEQVIPGVYRGIPGGPVDDEVTAIRIELSRLPVDSRRQMRFSSFEMEDNVDALKAVQRFALMRPPHHFLTLAGEPGRGKTHLAIAALWSWLETGGNGCYFQAEEILDALRSGFSRPPDDPASAGMIMNYAKCCGMLVLDDLGAHVAGQRSAEGPSWAEAKFDEIIDHRWLHHRRTLITLNVRLEGLPPRLADRIQEGQIFVLRGKSHRVARGNKLRGKQQGQQACHGQGGRGGQEDRPVTRGEGAQETSPERRGNADGQQSIMAAPTRAGNLPAASSP